MNNDLISRSELKKQFAEGAYTSKGVREIIDNAPTVPLPDFKEGYKQAILDSKTNYVRPKGEINADLFKQIFGIYATELWSMSESQFLEWLNSEYDCKEAEE